MATPVPICQGRFDEDPPPPEDEEKDLEALKVFDRRCSDEDCGIRPYARMEEDRMALAAIGVIMM